MRIRPTRPGDLEQIVALTRSLRAQLAAWSPTYFRPRDGADEGHALFLGFVVDSDDHETFAVELDDRVAGFFQLVGQPSHWWVDDLCLDPTDAMAAAAELLVATIDRRPLVTCVAAADADRAEALSRVGFTVASSYWSRLLSVDDARPAPTAPKGPIVGDRPPHTFGGAPFDPEAVGALAVADEAGNVVIGSPGVEPPIYDPGGPTTVVDHLGGPKRDQALRLAIGAAAGRNDAQLVVVAAADDEELATTLSAEGFARQVDLFTLAP